MSNPLAPTRLSTAFSLVLDLRTRRIFHHRGAYNSMQDVKISLPIISNEHNFAPHQDYSSPGSVSYETLRPYMMQRPMEARQFGYTIPSEQTTYDGPSSSHWL